MKALADEVTKYGESQLLGFAKGALARGLFSASFLLCLKILTMPATKVREGGRSLFIIIYYLLFIIYYLLFIYYYLLFNIIIAFFIYCRRLTVQLMNSE
jgi:hypothetical protein